ncbi:MAG: hypothetical protein ACLS90_03245 [Clostridia bacterium]
MRKIIKIKQELFDYLMYGYAYELEDVQTQIGTQKRLKDNELEEELKKKTKENISANDLSVELKLGPQYNRRLSPWVQIYTQANKSGTKGKYIGISFLKETNEVELWIGFGISNKKKKTIEEEAKEYKMKYAMLEPQLKHDFEYCEENSNGIIIKKKYYINYFNEKEFEKDLNYLSNLYKKYESRFDKVVTLENNTKKNIDKNITYEEINKRMLELIEEVGELAAAIKKMSKK